MNRKLQCLQPALVNRMGPILLQDKSRLHVAQSMLQKLNELGYQVLPLLPYSPDLSLKDNSLQAKCSHNQQEAEKLSKCSLNPKAWIFMLQESANLFLIGKNVLIVIIPILIKKDVFEPNNNNLKFMVRNQ